MVAIAYLVGLVMGISSLWITAMIHIIQFLREDLWTWPSPVLGKFVGQWVDLILMIYNAVLLALDHFLRSIQDEKIPY